jgi:hypothetical protein
MQIATRPANNSGEILAHLPRIGGVIPMYVDGEWRLAAGGNARTVRPGKRAADCDDRRGDRGRRRSRNRGGAQSL